MSNLTNKFKEEGRKIRQEIRERTVGYILAALGLVAGLAWNEAIQALIREFFHLQRNSIFAKFIYATLMTLVVVVLSIYFVRLIDRKEGEK